MPAPRASIIFDADNSSLHQATNQNLRDLQNQSREAASLGRSVGNLVSAFVTYQTVLATLRAAKQGEEFLNASREFGRYVSNVEAGAARLSRAANGTVNNMRLMQMASEAFRMGLDFSTVELALKFAEQQSDRTGQSIEQVFEQVARALAKTEAGVGRNNTVLVRYGITGSTTLEIMRQMERQLSDVNDELDDQSDAVAQAEARWQNATLKIGVAIRQNILPALELVGRLLENANPSGTTGALALASDRFSDARLDAGLRIGASENALSAQAVLGGLYEASLKGTFSLEQAQKGLEELIALQQSAPAKLTGAYQEAISRISQLIEQQKSVTANVPFGPTDRDFELNQELLDKQAAEQKTAAEAAKQARLAADQQLRESLQQKRDVVKAEIQLGRATYADLKILLDQQETDNKAFLDKDLQAKIGWLQDAGLVYQQDRQNAENAAAEKYNTYRRYIDGVLSDESLATEERYQKALEGVNGALELEQFDLEQRRVLYAQKQQIEQEYRQFILNGYQEQMNLLMTLFGEPTLQIIDSFFTQSELRFEDYLKNLVRTLARYAAQMALLRLFGGILGFGSPLALAGGIGGASGGLGALSIPHLPPLTTIPGNITNTIQNHSGPVIVQPNIRIGVDDQGLFVAVERGRQQYQRSTF